MSSTLFTTVFAGSVDHSLGTNAVEGIQSTSEGNDATSGDVNQQDVLNFNEAFSQNQQATSAVKPTSSHPLSHLASLEADAMNKLQNLSTSMNPGDYMKTARSLSAYQLETMLTTKVIAKSTQAVEKLTNLQ